LNRHNREWFYKFRRSDISSSDEHRPGIQSVQSGEAVVIGQPALFKADILDDPDSLAAIPEMESQISGGHLSIEVREFYVRNLKAGGFNEQIGFFNIQGQLCRFGAFVRGLSSGLGRRVQILRNGDQLAVEPNQRSRGEGHQTSKKDHEARLGSALFLGILGTWCLCWSLRNIGDCVWWCLFLGWLCYDGASFVFFWGLPWTWTLGA
jgi:hypothetical protein